MSDSSEDERPAREEEVSFNRITFQAKQRTGNVLFLNAN